MAKSGTALISAILDGDLTTAQRLLDHGAKPNKTYYGVSPLMLSSLHGYLSIIKALIDLGANVDAQDTVGATALIYAAWNGHTDAVKVLLDNGANAGVKSKGGRTALMTAGHNGHNKTVELLRKQGQVLRLESRKSKAHVSPTGDLNIVIKNPSSRGMKYSAVRQTKRDQERQLHQEIVRQQFKEIRTGKGRKPTDSWVTGDD